MAETYSHGPPLGLKNLRISEKGTPVPLATVSFGELLLLILEFFLLFAWIWILITVIIDLFRDHQLSGIAKAVWVFFLVFLPFVGVLIYLIVRGSGMRDRALKEQA